MARWSRREATSPVYTWGVTNKELDSDKAQPSSRRRRWTRLELLIVLELYCRIPFGQMHSRNPEVIRVAEAIERTPGAAAMKLVNLASLDPGLKQRGVSGLRNASASDRAIWQEMNADWGAFVAESSLARRSYALVDDSETDTLSADEAIEDRVTERQGVVTQRVGQDFFRKAVLSAYNYKCCISGLSVEELLAASHIKPWSTDEKNRLNPRNGLLLSVLHHEAFDLGLITLDDDLKVRVSQSHLPNDDRFFSQTIAAYDGHPIAAPEKFGPHPDFLAYHREYVFRG